MKCFNEYEITFTANIAIPIGVDLELDKMHEYLKNRLKSIGTEKYIVANTEIHAIHENETVTRF